MDSSTLLSSPKLEKFSALTEVINEIHGLVKNKNTLTKEESDCLNKRIYSAVELVESNEAMTSNSSNSKNLAINNTLMARGTLLWAYLPQTMGDIKYDSYPSVYLPQFPMFQRLSASNFDQLKSNIEKKYELESGTVDHTHEKVLYIISNLQVKNGITDYFEKKLSQGMSHCELFYSLTGYKLQNNKLIDVTITNTNIFFSFVFEEKVSGGEAFSHSSLSDRSNVKCLINTLKLEASHERECFPAVGKWNDLHMDEQLLDDLTKHLNQECNIEINRSALEGTLTTMSYLLPHKDAERFFVHDACGHSWQECLCEFEHLYSHLAELIEPCPLSRYEDAISSSSSESKIIDNCKTTLIEYYAFQVNVVTNAILSEYTADAIEYHLQKKLEQKGEGIPSSSMMRHFSLFLDLSLQDTIKHIGNVLTGINQEFISERASSIEALLLKHGVSSKNTPVIVTRLNEWFDHTIVSNFKCGEGLSNIEWNVYAQLIMLYKPLDEAAQKFSAMEFQQLLLCLTSTYQSDPSNMYWVLNRVISNFRYCST